MVERFEAVGTEICLIVNAEARCGLICTGLACVCVVVHANGVDGDPGGNHVHQLHALAVVEQVVMRENPFIFGLFKIQIH